MADNNRFCAVKPLVDAPECPSTGPRGRVGPPGPQGPVGPQGPPGNGIPPEGEPGQVLAKASYTDYDTEWITLADIGAVWGNITGTLSNQTDLQTALNNKQNTITLGLTSQYFRGDLSLATFPTLLSQFTNDTNFITDLNGLFVNDATDSTLVRSGAGPYTLGLNLAAANIWLAAQSVPDDAYGVAWATNFEVPTKNAVYNIIESIIFSISTGYVPYTGATANVDLNTNGFICTGLSTLGTLLVNETTPYDNSVAFEVNGKGGFNNGTQSAYFANTGTSTAGEFTGQVNVIGAMSVGDTPNISAYLGVNNGSINARLVDGSNIAGVFSDGTRSVNIADGTYAIDATGDNRLNGTTTFNFNAVNDVGYLAGTNGSTSIVLVDGTNSIDAVGNVDITGALNLLDSSSSVIIGDIGGDARGVGSIDIQQSRTASTQVASGQDSIAFGKGNRASSRNSIAIGTNNSASTTLTAPYANQSDQYAIAIGHSNTVNISVLYNPTSGVAIGRACQSTGSRSTTVGLECTASTSTSSAIGFRSTASGLAASAFGYQNTASGSQSVAFGYSNFAIGAVGAAFGNQCSAVGSNSFAVGVNARSYASSSGTIGNELANTRANTVMLGNSSTFYCLTPIGIATSNNELALESIHAGGNILATNIASLGAEKITNGTFTGSATGWTVGSFAYSANKITKTADGTTALTQTSAAMVTPLVIGETYILEFTVSLLTVGSIVISCGGVTLGTIDIGTSTVAISKTFKYIFKAVSTADLSFAPSNTSRITTLDTVSLKKITGGDLIGLGSLYLGQDDTNRMQVSVSSTGAVTLNANGAGAEFLFSDSVRFNGGTKSSDGSAGFTGTGAYTNFTIKNGLITAAS